MNGSLFRLCSRAVSGFILSSITGTFLSMGSIVAAEEVSDGAVSVREVSLDFYGDPIPYGGSVRLGTERYRPIGDGWHSSIAFTQDTRTLVSVAGSYICRWDALTGERKSIKKLDLYTRGFAAAPDKSTFAFAFSKFIEAESRNEHGIQIRDLSTGELVGQIAVEGHQDDTKLVYTPDSRSLIHAGAEGRIRIFDLSLQEELLDFQLPGTERRRIDCVAISPSGEQIAAACARKLFIWNWLEGESPEVLEGYDRLYSVTYSPDGKSLVLGQNQFGKRREEVQILNLETRAITGQFADPVMERIRVPNMLFASEGKYLIVPNADYVGTKKDNAILVWDMASGELTHRLQADNTSPGMVALSPDDQLLATASEGVITVWDFESGRQIANRLISHTASMTGVRFSNDGKRIVTASDDETARIWDSRTGQQVGRIDHDHWIRGMAVSHDNKWIVTSSLDDTVRLWDAEALKEVYRLAGHGEHGGYRSVAFSSDSSRFVTFGDDGYLRVWDVATGRLLLEEELKPGGKSLKGEEGFAFSENVKGALSADASRLLVMRREGTYVFDTETGREIKQIPVDKPIESGCFSAEGRYLLFTRPTEGPKQTPLQDGRVRFSAPNKFEAVLMDLADETEHWTFEIDGRFGSIGLSPNGRFAALCQRGKPKDAIYVVDAKNGNLLTKIEGVEKVTWDSSDSRLCFSRDSRRLAVALENTTAVVWDLEELGVWTE